MSQNLKGYWGIIQSQMNQKLNKNHHLEALVVRHARYNRNVLGLSFRVKNGHLVRHHYGDKRQHKILSQSLH